MATVPRAERFYRRYGNPTVQAFEDAIAELEGAEAARAFASGMGAIATSSSRSARPATTSSPSASSTPAPSCCCRRACPRFGIDVTFVDGTDAGRVRRAAVRPGKTMLVFAETPANPRLDAGRPRRDRGDRRADHGRRLHVRHAARAAAARPRRRPRAALGDEGHRRAQRRHARRGRRQRASSSTGSGASRSCRARTPRRSTP